MLKLKNNKKGFTIVELVIVIAVIAILAAVLIPTFSNVIEKAHKSSCQQAAKAKFDELYADDMEDGTADGQIDGTAITKPAEVKTYTANGSEVTKFEYESDGYTATYEKKSGASKYTWTVQKDTGSN